MSNNMYKPYLTLSLLLVLGLELYAINPPFIRDQVQSRGTLKSAQSYRTPIFRWYGQEGGTGVFRLKFGNDDMSAGYFIIKGYEYQPPHLARIDNLFLVEELGGGNLSRLIHLSYTPIGETDDFKQELSQELVSNHELLS